MEFEKLSKEELIERLRYLLREREQIIEGEPEFTESHRFGRGVIGKSSFYENSNDLVITCSLEGNILYLNTSALQVFQFDSLNIGLKNIDELVHPEFTYKTFEYLRELIARGRVEGVETVFMSSHGENIHVKGNIFGNYENDGLVAYTWVLHDKTHGIIAEQALQLYFQIANACSGSEDLDGLLEEIHGLLIDHIKANNFFLALTDYDRNQFVYPYYVDEVFGGKVVEYTRELGKGLSDYVILKKEPVFLYEKEIDQLANNGEVVLGSPSPKIWLGVPVIIDKQVSGVIAIKSHSDKIKFNQNDLELLTFIAGQIGLVIERQRNEQEISEGRARLNAIFDSGTHLIWSVNQKRGLTSFNTNYSDAIFSQYGVTPEIDVDGTKPRLLLSSPQYHSIVSEKYEGAFKGKLQHFATEIADTNGQNVWWEIYLNPIFLPDGTIEEVSGMAHNVTQKKQSDFAIKASEEKFRSIVESFQDIYFRAELSGKITMVSPSLREYTGFKATDVVGKNITNFILPVEDMKGLLKRLVRQKRVKNYEAQVKTKGGGSFSTIANISLLTSANGKAEAFEGVVRDISSIKEASAKLQEAKELAENSLKVKESFLANMSHEIRTPMNGIIAMIDLMQETGLDLTQKDYLNTIQKSSKTLMNILNDILDLSKLEAGKMELRLDSVSIKDTVDKLYFLFKQQADSKSIGIHYEVAEDIPDFILADETRIIQVLSNLTSNAIKFTSNGDINIRVILLAKHRKFIKLKFEVEDSGIGISEENISMLFQNFNQIDSSITKSYGGTGLGLSISKELCRLMGGEIGVDSVLGEGSKFWFVIEARQSESAPETTEAENTSIENYHFGDRKPLILLVDDNVVNQRVAQLILEKVGCRVHVANNGAEAVEAVQKGDTYSVILMDIQMPVMDGITATKMIKELKKDDVPPIVAMTAYSMEEDEKMFLEAGLDHYLSKPITPKKLVLKLGELLGEEVEILSEEQIDDTDEDVLNQFALDQLLGIGGIDMVKEMFGDYEKETAQQLKDMNKFLKKGETEQILSKLHSVKGTSGTVGVQRVASLAKAIESKLKAKEKIDLDAKLKELGSEFKAFQKEYKVFINDKADVG